MHKTLYIYRAVA